MGFPGGKRVPLRGQHRLSFELLHTYRTMRGASGWEAHTDAYSYQFYAPGDREIVAFHWHPGRGGHHAPHAHFRQLNDPIPMGKCHVPTGRISLPSVVRFLIEELAVEPLRPDWSAVLTDAEQDAVVQ